MLSAIDAALQSDGLIPAPKGTTDLLPPPREGYYLIAAVASSPADKTASGDYHFYRQMEDGTWWHDPGNLAPTNVDAKGKTITDPVNAARDYTKTPLGNQDGLAGNYKNFIGYYYVPKDGLPVADGSLPPEVLFPGGQPEKEGSLRSPRDRRILAEAARCIHDQLAEICHLPVRDATDFPKPPQKREL